MQTSINFNWPFFVTPRLFNYESQFVGMPKSTELKHLIKSEKQERLKPQQNQSRKYKDK